MVDGLMRLECGGWGGEGGGLLETGEDVGSREGGTGVGGQGWGGGVHGGERSHGDSYLCIRILLLVELE